jgi:hypothetical protein
MGRENLPLWLQEKIAMLDLVSPTGLLTGIGTVHTAPNSDRIYWIGSQDASDTWGRSAPFGATYVENEQDGRYYLKQIFEPWYTIGTSGSNNTFLGIHPSIVTAGSATTNCMTGKSFPQSWARDGKFAGLTQSQQTKKAKLMPLTLHANRVQEALDRKYDDCREVINAMLRAYDSCKAALTKDSK